MYVGGKIGLKPGHTSSIRRIEGAILSYHADLDIGTNPYEVDLGRLVNLDCGNNFVGRAALAKIREEGVRRKQVGLEIECLPLSGPNDTFWDVKKNDKLIGKVTSAVYSPRLMKNIGLAMVSKEFSDIGNIVEISTGNLNFKACIVEKPFYDPKKKIPSTKAY